MQLYVAHGDNETLARSLLGEQTPQWIHIMDKDASASNHEATQRSARAEFLPAAAEGDQPPKRV